MKSNDWKTPKAKRIQIRHGSKDPWIEMLVTHPDGTQTKLIARKVERFYSEYEEREAEVKL